ncbi:hypothetical protein AC625_24465 [Peribacillus loiseleuriae]|uniref:Uncharacterized protein n=1 Tax=Peribacillus loiseleuriae TaxID=1679170 RepID=A0A0K9G985_9BACI|nr:hypothetical protein AC625_24465 [Peribacillus loiseleuriae]
MFEINKMTRICMNQSSKMYFDQECHFYVEICFLLIIEYVSAFCYSDNRLDGMRGCHSIWRRWGRYQGEVEEISCFICIKLAFLCSLEASLEAENVDVTMLYKIMHKQ